MTIRITIVGLLISLSLSTFCPAGILAHHPNSVLDIVGNPATGSFTKQSGNLNVTFDYAVFRANDFIALFPDSGYTPAGSLVYTYQVFVNAPPSTISVANIKFKGAASFSLGPAPGWFNTAALEGDQVPSSSDFNSIIANWNFHGPSGELLPALTIDPGESSWGLALSSNNAPQLTHTSLQVNTFLGIDILGPAFSPSNQLFIPEPTTSALALAALCLAMSRRRSF